MRLGNRPHVRNLVLAFLFLGLAAWVVPSYFSAERYRRRLQAALEQTLHRPVQFGAVSFRLIPRPGFSIDDLRVDEDSQFGSEPFARVDHVDCDLRWRSLWRSPHMDFAGLHLKRPSFNVVLNPQGEWNVEKLLLQSGVTAPPGRRGAATLPAAAQLNLDVDDARINFLVGDDKKAFALTDVQARLEVNPAQRRVLFRITASPVRSDLDIPTPGPVQAEGTWIPGADLGGPLDVHVRTRGALLYDWIPIVSGKNPQLYGVVDSDLHVTGSLPDLKVEGQASLTQFQRWEELPPSDSMRWAIRFRGRAVRGAERVQVESLDASFADSQLHFSGSVDKLVTDPQIDCVLSLDHSRLEDVLAVARRLWPQAGSWRLKGRADAMLTIRGSWKQRQYGGFVGARQVSLETSSGSFNLSDVALRINHRGAVLAPLQITLAPHVILTAQGAIERGKSGPRYAVQLAAKSVPLHAALAFGRGLGVRGLQAIDGTGALTTIIRLAGSAWPWARPALTASAEVRSARLLIPGFAEPLNLPRASVQFNGDQITVAPVVAVLGTSVFNAQLAHRGPRSTPWKFFVQANDISLEQGAMWFEALGPRRPLPFLERLPGLSSLAARRGAASQIFSSLNAEGRLAASVLSYRGVVLKKFQGTFSVAGRSVRMRSATFSVAGGRGQAAGAADFMVSPPRLSAEASLTNIPVQNVVAGLPGPARELRAFLNVTGDLATRGWAREELADNLTGRLQLRFSDISFGDFDPLGTLAEQAHWGTLEPARSPITARAATMSMEVRDRHCLLETSAINLNGASLHLAGRYAWAGAINVDVRADLRQLHRRWVLRDGDFQNPAGLSELRLGGSIDHLVVNPQPGVASAGRLPRGVVR